MDMDVLGLILAFYNLAVKKGGGGGGGVAGAVHWKGGVDHYSDLPKSPSEGDCYTVKYVGSSGTVLDGSVYVWAKDAQTGSFQWIAFGSGGSLRLSLTQNTLTVKAGAADLLNAAMDHQTFTLNY